MAAFENIEACVFDAYGTLYDFNSAAERCRADLGDKADALSAEWRAKQLQYTWLRTLMGQYEPFWNVTGQALDYALASQGIEADQALRDKLLDLYMNIAAFPEVPGVLTKLSEGGLRTAILSNGSPNMLAGAAAATGCDQLLEASISIDEIQIYKPDPRCYQLAVDKLGVPKERIAFQSSNSWDANGAAAFGFNVVWINRYGQPAERLPSQPDHILDSLEELPALLGVS